MDLSGIKTCDLVKELTSRDGVEAHSIGPSASIEISADGPCIVLVVID